MPPRKKAMRRQGRHSLEFKMQVVQYALSLPEGNRIKPTCRQFQNIAPGAVAYARHMQSLGEAPPLPPLPPPLRVLPEVTQVELQLHLSATNPTGYKGVYVKRGTGRFEAKVCSYGQLHHIGNFDTALEAAEAYARHVRLLESA